MLNSVDLLNKSLLELCDGNFPKIDETIKNYLEQKTQHLHFSKDNPEITKHYFYYYAQYCLENGAQVACHDPENGETPLIKAANKGNEAFVDLLLGYQEKVDQADGNGHTALHGACAQGALSIVNKLLAKKANLLACTISGGLPIHFAIHSPEILSLLLKNGSPVNPKTLTLDTPLHFAASNNAPVESFTVLLEYKADFTLINLLGFTALDILRAHKPDSPQFILLQKKAQAFQAVCKTHADNAQETFFFIMYKRHTTCSADISLPPEMSQHIVNHTSPEDFSIIAKKEFYQDEASLEASVKRLSL